jgi:hypothetical protein
MERRRRRWCLCSMRSAKTVTTEATMKSVEEVRAFLEGAHVVDGPAELRTLVAELWPELLHKVKPPKSEMH